MSTAHLALCSVEGCGSPVQKQGHTLCLPHWKERQNHTIKESVASYVVPPQPSTTHDENNTALTSTRLGEHFKLAAKQINRVLLDLGWIEKEGNGWKPSALGEKLKAEKILYQKKTPFVVWHPDICKSRILQNAISDLLSIEVEAPIVAEPSPIQEAAADKTDDFRDKFPPGIRASDGHMVRSRAEAMIDAWLYENRIVHAYERLVRVEQKMYCDFYLPELDLYIEFWGMESNPKYKARKEVKLDTYRKNGLNLIEIKDSHIDNLDDYLMSQLVKFGYKAK